MADDHAIFRDGLRKLLDGDEEITIIGEAQNGAGDLPDPDFFVTRSYDHDELLPWDFIDHHIYKWFLAAERKKAHFEHQSPPCDVVRCTVCGAC